MSEIREFVLSESLFDTHEHQEGYNQDWKSKIYEEFIAYATADIATAGGYFQRGNIEQNFKQWQFVRTTGYGQAANIATQKLFNLEFNKENAEKITEKMQDFIKDKTPEKIYSELYKLANIKGAITDIGGNKMCRIDYFTNKKLPDFFKRVLRYEDLDALNTDKSKFTKEYEDEFNISLEKLSDLDNFLDDYTQKCCETGMMVGFKIAIAYSRSLNIVDVSYKDANEVFSKLKQNKQVDIRPLSDYLIHKLFQRAEKLNTVVQIHTGYQAGNWQDIRWTDPCLLIPIFQKYKNIKFDIFHAGWPFSEKLGAIGKQFPNVWLNMCWAWSMNPVQMERTLNEWLACVPCNKIFAFGADVWSPFPMIGYAIQARNGIANVLEKKINSGEYDLNTAKFVAERIMHKNAEEFYKVNFAKTAK